MNTMPFIESLFTALRYWLRTLRREPMFTAAGALTLALGIGATTAIFSVVKRRPAHVAAVGPARRAMRVDPVQSLRQE